jgi:hypothetical protein
VYTSCISQRLSSVWISSNRLIIHCKCSIHRTPPYSTPCRLFAVQRSRCTNLAKNRAVHQRHPNSAQYAIHHASCRKRQIVRIRYPGSKKNNTFVVMVALFTVYVLGCCTYVVVDRIVVQIRESGGRLHGYIYLDPVRYLHTHLVRRRSFH